MRLDYWHIRRYARVQGMTPGESLPFGGPPFVIGGVVSLPEPVWRTAVATAVEHGAPSIFAEWTWQSALSTELAASLLQSLRTIIIDLKKTKDITHPDDLTEEDPVDVDTVLTALQVIYDLLALAVQRGYAVETWSE
jgi:hypothetical protein